MTPAQIMSRRRLLLVVLVLAACESEPGVTEPEPQTAKGPATAAAAEGEASDEAPEAGPMPESWVRSRVESARERLTASEAGARVWRAIEAHGGLATWLDFGTVEFEFDYQPVEKPESRKHTFNRVDLWRSRAHQKELGEEGDATFGWDGERAWIVPSEDAFPSPARFWATTPYYFVGIPWVLADPGTRFIELPDGELDGTGYERVKIEYVSGTGDAPDDHYVLYLHPETHHVDAIRYIVSYPGFFPEGGHSPEKLMRYLDQREVQGLRVAHRYETYMFDAEHDAPAPDKVTDTTLSRVRFGERYPAHVFAPPTGAVLSELK